MGQQRPPWFRQFRNLSKVVDLLLGQLEREQGADDPGEGHHVVRGVQLCTMSKDDPAAHRLSIGEVKDTNKIDLREGLQQQAL